MSELAVWMDTVKEIERKELLLGYDRQAKEERVRELRDMIAAINAEIVSMSGEIRDMRFEKESYQNKISIAHLEAEQAAKEVEASQAINEIADLIAELAGDLQALSKAHDYQHQDILSIVQAYLNGLGGMLNANDMGLGKTMEMAIALYILKKIFFKREGRKPNILLATKKSLVIKDSTKTEILRWCPDFVILTSKDATNGNKTSRDALMDFYGLLKPDVFICNYEFLRTTGDKLNKVHWDFFIVDEVHKLKGGANNSGPTAIWKAAKEIAIQAEFKLFLSGTPMVNKAEEMWAYLHIFDPETFPSLKAFRRDFTTYKRFAGEMKLEVDPNKILKNALNGRMIRRSRFEVGLELPELTLEIRDVGHTELQGAAYDQMRTKFFIWLEEMGEMVGSSAIIAQLIRLRQINLWPVIDFKTKVRDEYGEPVLDENGRVMVTVTRLDIPESAKVDEAMDIIENIGDEQIIIGSTLNDNMFEIERRCKEQGITCGVLHGDTSNMDFEKEFQQGTLQVLCINTAMGEGLNLQKNPSEWPGGASYGILMDKWYSPARQEQFIGRIQRQGSRIPVTFYILHNTGTVDDFIQQLNDEKNASFGNIMESDIIRPKSEWMNLLRGKI
jgi:SNF2 family DNA or RNA helicase